MRGRDRHDTGARVARRRRAPSLGAPSRRASQSGYTLIEVLLCVVLVGVVVLGMAAGLLTLVRSTSANSGAQELQVAIDNWSENLKALAYLPCADADAYEAAHAAWPAAWQPPPDLDVSFEIVDVQHWHKGPRNAGGELTAGPGFYDDDCVERDGAPVDEGAQLLTLRVARGGETREATIVKAVR